MLRRNHYLALSMVWGRLRRPRSPEISYLTRVTRLRIECYPRLRQSAPFLPIVVRFRAASAKTNNRKKGKYHAAAGKYQLEAATA
jgi:hypothetical protein